MLKKTFHFWSNEWCDGVKGDFSFNFKDGEQHSLSQEVDDEESRLGKEMVGWGPEHPDLVEDVKWNEMIFNPNIFCDFIDASEGQSMHKSAPRASIFRLQPFLPMPSREKTPEASACTLPQPHLGWREAELLCLCPSMSQPVLSMQPNLALADKLTHAKLCLGAPGWSSNTGVQNKLQQWPHQICCQPGDCD